jgi:hypothetical protein
MTSMQTMPVIADLILSTTVVTHRFFHVQVARLVPHLSNGAFIASERGADPTLDASLEDILVFIPKDSPRVMLIESMVGKASRVRRTDCWSQSMFAVLFLSQACY